MTDDRIKLNWSQNLPVDQVIALYRSNGWTSADKPQELLAALAGSHRVATAWQGEKLIGLGNAISDGHLVVYYPHLIVHSDYQGRGIGTMLARALVAQYEGFHQQILVADGRAGRTEPLWIYAGTEH